MKNKVKIDVYGVKCTVLTSESKSYMLQLARQVEETVKNMQTSSKDIAFAVSALSYLHDVKTLEKEIESLKTKISEQEEKIKEFKEKSEVKKYTSNPLRFKPDTDKELDTFFEKIDE